MIRIDGKVAVVTGAGRGLGRAYANALAAAGAAVVVNDAEPGPATDVAEQIVAGGGSAVAVGSSVGAADVADELVATAVREFGTLDVMVTNAGVLRDRTLRNTTDADFDAVLATHLRGTFTCARSAFRRFREQGNGGRLIVVGSVAGQRGSFGQTAYSAAKAGIAAFARTWAMEGASSGITANAVIPVALTRMVATIPALSELVERYERGEPIPDDALRRGLGTPEHVAPLVVFLASDAAAGVTGQCIGIGGTKLSIWTHPAEAAIVVNDGPWDADGISAAWGSVLSAASQPVVTQTVTSAATAS